MRAPTIAAAAAVLVVFHGAALAQTSSMDVAPVVEPSVTTETPVRPLDFPPDTFQEAAAPPPELQALTPMIQQTPTPIEAPTSPSVAEALVVPAPAPPSVAEAAVIPAPAPPPVVITPSLASPADASIPQADSPPVESTTTVATSVAGPVPAAAPLLLRSDDMAPASTTAAVVASPSDGNSAKSPLLSPSTSSSQSIRSDGPKSKGDETDGKSRSKSDSSAAGSAYLDTTLINACVCKDLRKVSLMSASDYCLHPAAAIGNKCGNAAVGEKGECPLAGAQPCQDTGHVLANDSMCAYDKRDDTYKCVASKEDLYIQKNGKRKKPSNSTSVPPAASSKAARTASSGQTVMRIVVLAASLAVGLAAVA